MADRIYHLALAGEWDPIAPEYRRSTIGRSLEDEGFVHCSTAAQVQGVADASYRGRADVVLLAIDATAVGSEVRVEAGFPHVYGPIPRGAVVAAVAVPLGPDGRLRVEPLLDSGL